MRHFPPFIYGSMGSISTIGLIVGIALLISPGEAGPPRQQRGSGRVPAENTQELRKIEDKIAKLEKRLLGKNQDSDGDTKKRNKTEIATAYYEGETSPQKPAAEPPGSGRRE